MGHCGFTLAPASRGAARPRRAQPRARRGHLRRRDGRRHRVDLDDLRRVPRRGRRAAEGHQLRRQHRPLRAAHLRHGRARVRGARRPTTTSRRWQPSCATRSRAGAYGFTTSRTAPPRDLRRPPGRVAARVAGTRSRASSSVLGDAGRRHLPARRGPAVARRAGRARRRGCVELAVDTGVPFAIGAIERPTALGPDRRASRRPAAACSGITHCRGIGTMSSFRSQLPFDRLPEWQALRALPARRAAARARAIPRCARASCWAAHNGHLRRTRSAARPARPTSTACGCSIAPLPPNPTVAEVAAARGVDPVELMIDLALETTSTSSSADRSRRSTTTACSAMLRTRARS